VYSFGNDDIRKELEIFSVGDKMIKYGAYLLKCPQKVDDTRIYIGSPRNKTETKTGL
jgi:hypothetical protein